MSIADFFSLLLIAIGLSADCFAVALGISSGAARQSWKDAIRVSVSFGLFQALMPVLGWLGGQTIVSLIEDYDHWIAFGLLAFVGGRMIWESFGSPDDEGKKLDITRWLVVLTLSVATSIDALAVGLSFGFLEVNIALASPIIGLTSLLVTLAGFTLGRKGGSILGKRAETAGGIILLAIALRILLSHIL